MKIIVLYNIFVFLISMLFCLDCLIFINISYLFFYFIYILIYNDDLFIVFIHLIFTVSTFFNYLPMVQEKLSDLPIQLRASFSQIHILTHIPPHLPLIFLIPENHTRPFTAKLMFEGTAYTRECHW